MTKRKGRKLNKKLSDCDDCVKDSQEDNTEEKGSDGETYVDPETKILIEQLYELYHKIVGDTLREPEITDEPLRNEFRIIYHAISNSEKLYVAIINRLQQDRRWFKIKRSAHDNMSNVLEDVKQKIEELREITKRYNYEDPQQRSALSLMQIRFEELCLDSGDMDELDDIVGSEFASKINSLEKYSECVEESQLNELILRDTEELYRLKETHKNSLEELKKEEKTLDKELAALERQIKKVKKQCKFSSVVEEVHSRRRELPIKPLEGS